jgi:hypothetical protein
MHWSYTPAREVQLLHCVPILKGESMTWQDILLVIDFVVLVGIYLDDHAVRKMTEESLEIARESLEAQKQYLDLRRKWYTDRVKKKENVQVAVTEQKGAGGISSGSDTNTV